MHRISGAAAFLLIGAMITSAAHATVTLETVPVGDVGNPNDPLTGNLYGGVNYAYNIGKYEVTIGQYVEFLNAVAATDPKSLWSVGLAQHTTAPNITRSGSPGSYTYSVVGSANNPAGIGWTAAVRFVNWLDHGQPATGIEDATTTEGGAYTLTGVVDINTVARNPGFRWYLPSESEWYKAAYYQPISKGGDSDGYWLYPTRSNSPPYSAPPPGTASPDPTRTGNFYEQDGPVNGYNDGYAATGTTALIANVDFLTDVGAYGSAPSYYGTFDQGGNAFEYNEGIVVTSFGTFRGQRGGDAFGNYAALQSTYRPDMRSISVYGDFRVVSMDVVPEPTTATLLLLGMLGCGWRRRR